MSARQFERMAQQVAALRPDLDAAGVTYACNLISNAIRQINTDMSLDDIYERFPNLYERRFSQGTRLKYLESQVDSICWLLERAPGTRNAGVSCRSIDLTSLFI